MSNGEDDDLSGYNSVSHTKDQGMNDETEEDEENKDQSVLPATHNDKTNLGNKSGSAPSAL